MSSTRHHFAVVPFAATYLIFAVIAGCGGSGSTTSAPVTPTAPPTPALTASNSFCVTDNPLSAFLPETQGPSILQFSRTANGAVSPASTITGPVGLNFDAVTVDAAGTLYAGGRLFNGSTQSGPEIEVYTAGANGTATPTRTITAGLSTLITTGSFRWRQTAQTIST